jgi:hypothetical protein
MVTGIEIKRKCLNEANCIVQALPLQNDYSSDGKKYFAS